MGGEAGEAGSLGEFLSRVAGALAAAQQRSAGLVVAVFEGSFRDAGLEGLREQMVAQREVTAAWIVQGMTRLAPLRPGLSFEEAVDVVLAAAGSGRVHPADPASPVGCGPLPAVDR